MRSLNQTEINKISKEDIDPLIYYLNRRGLMNEKRFNGIMIKAEKDEVLGRANGKNSVINGERVVVLRESLINNSKERPETLYHEIGHHLIGLKGLSFEKREVLEKLYSFLVYTRNDNKHILKEETKLYEDGIKLLEEFMVTKFSQEVCHKAKGIPIPKKEEYRHPQISGDYVYNATFNSGYGICESICEDFVNKTYGNYEGAERKAFNNTFFTGFFEKYDNVELMKILGNLGHVKRAIYSFAGQEAYEYSPQQIHKILDDTKIMIGNIQPKGKKQITSSELLEVSSNVLKYDTRSRVKTEKEFKSRLLEIKNKFKSK